MLTKGMAIDWGPHGIHVNGLGPGYFKTELTEALVKDETFSHWLTQRTPCRRWGNVEELAPAVVFLASDAATFVNGHILYVDGGERWLAAVELLLTSLGFAGNILFARARGKELGLKLKRLSQVEKEEKAKFNK